MIDRKPAPTVSEPSGWVVHVEVELSRSPDVEERAGDLAVAMVGRAGPADAAVTIRGDVVRVTWRRPQGGADADAGQALAHALDATLQLLAPHVTVRRVRRAWTEVDARPVHPQRRRRPGLPQQHGSVPLP